ncbi:hypothetical protein EXIGLDRAFT_776946 [Exidia glandulosa HHB12029]|uniref:Uncharacterized protein n=1 Tax=Exidia glandulosa HHB12029 TaxID=1314781 RepID=A0A165D915_EXIGL|nr:hypothetical protein EXIGLDRAFT_776946 [Exidia glandulosa HHB12029]
MASRPQRPAALHRSLSREEITARNLIVADTLVTTLLRIPDGSIQQGGALPVIGLADCSRVFRGVDELRTEFIRLARFVSVSGLHNAVVQLFDAHFIPDGAAFDDIRRAISVMGVRYALLDHFDSNVRALETGPPANPVLNSPASMSRHHEDDEDSEDDDYYYYETAAAASPSPVGRVGLFTRVARESNQCIYFASAHLSAPLDEDPSMRYLLGPMTLAETSSTPNAEIVVTPGTHGGFLRTTRRIPPNGPIVIAPFPVGVCGTEIARRECMASFFRSVQ